MSNKKGNIIFASIISVIFLATTYLFCLAKAYEWFDIKWLSNDFLIAVFGGAFASFLVVLLNELFSYFQYKRYMEDQLYSNTIFFLTNAIVVRNTLNNMLEKPNKQIVENMIENQKCIMLSSLRTICNIDYVTFRKKQNLLKKLQELKSKYYEYEKIITNITYLNLAINETKLQEIQKGNISVQVNASYDLIKRTIEEVKSDIEIIIEVFDSLMQKIDYSGRYSWKDNKEKIMQQDSISLDNGLLEKYLMRHKKSENDNSVH